MEGKSVETETKCEGDDQHQLSPTKPHHQIHHRASPLEFLKKRVKPGKKRRDSGHSEGGDCDSVSTIDEERSDGTPSSPTTTDPSSAASRRLSLDSASSQTSQPHQQSFSREKPRRGIAKVFHDLKHRSRARKSHSAPPASMDNNQVSSPLSPVAVDDDSFSSYATPMEAHSSGYSTPMFESNIASPESSLTESFVEEEEEAAEDTTTVETSQSPAAVPSIQLVNPPSTPGSPSTVDVETLSMLMSRTSIQTEPVDARGTLASSSSSNTGKPHFEATETQQEAAPCAEAVASVTSSVSSSSSGTSGSPSEASTSITTGQRSRIPLLSQHRASVPNYSSTKESTVAVPVATTSGDASKAQSSDRSASTSEIRFCFSEYINGDSASSPGRGFMRSLPSDPKMDPANNTTGNDANGYPKNEHLYKVLVIGELGTGKTSIIKRYVHQFFSQHYRATIGVDFALKVVHWDQSTVIRLQLWDIAGQERFGNMTRVYYKEAVGAFIVFDVTRSSTFESVTKWKQDLDSKVQLPDGSPIPCVLLANKCDQPKEGIAANPAKMDEYCKEKGFAGWFETSAKDNINIDDAAKFLVGTILQNDQWSTSIKEEDADKLELNGKGTSAAGDKKKSGCC